MKGGASWIGRWWVRELQPVTNLSAVSLLKETTQNGSSAFDQSCMFALLHTIKQLNVILQWLWRPQLEYFHLLSWQKVSSSGSEMVFHYQPWLIIPLVIRNTDWYSYWGAALTWIRAWPFLQNWNNPVSFSVCGIILQTTKNQICSNQFLHIIKGGDILTLQSGRNEKWRCNN